MLWNLVSPGDEPASLRARATVLALLLGVWTIPGLLSAVQIYAEEVVRNGHAVSVASILGYALPVWWAWVPLTLGVAALSRRFPLTGDRRAVALAVHVAGCVGIGLLHIGLSAGWGALAAPTDAGASVATRFVELTVVDDVRVLVNVFIYALIVGCVHAFDYYRESRERQLRTSRLEAQLKHAQLDALRAQLRPHFLFNTLSAIQTLTLRNGDRQSAQMIARLSEFLRTTLEDDDTLIPLADELDFVDQYVGIEKCRFGERLTVEVDVDSSVRSAPVPSLILQPLVENAIRHGIEPKEGSGRVVVEAWPDGDGLGLRVGDDGVGADPQTARRTGQGLSNTRSRLQQLYGDEASLEVRSSPGEGFAVTIHLPTAPSASSGDTLPPAAVSLDAGSADLPPSTRSRTQ